MRASGNGNSEICVQNLLQTLRGEVPYSRVKGLDARNFDRPADVARMEIEADALWVIGTYEPRVSANGVESIQIDGSSGDFRVTATVADAE